MGWCSGTEFFDGALNVFLKYVPEEKVQEVIGKWYEVFKYEDWDCESESDYYELLLPYLKKEYSDWYDFYE